MSDQTSTDLAYKMGWDAAEQDKALLPISEFPLPSNYEYYKMGYQDCMGDKLHNAPVSEEYIDFNDAPEGFEFTGEKRVPKAYEFYLSKGGKATALSHQRKNSQTRFILRCSHCLAQYARESFRPCPHCRKVKAR